MVGVSRFSVRIVLSHSTAKTSLGMFQCFTVSGIEKIYALEGYVMIFCRYFLSHSAENVRRGIL